MTKNRNKNKMDKSTDQKTISEVSDLIKLVGEARIAELEL